MNAFKAAKLMPLAVGGFNPKLKVTKFFGMAFPPFSTNQIDLSWPLTCLPSPCNARWFWMALGPIDPKKILKSLG